MLQTALSNPWNAALFAFDSNHGQTWSTASAEQASKVQFILSEKFLNSQHPFSEVEYREIGFPLKVGQVRDKAFIADAALVGRKHDYWMNPGRRPSLDVEAAIFDQFLAIDRFLYGQDNVGWFFSADVKPVKERSTHRQNATKYHADHNLDDASHVQFTFKQIRSGGYCLPEGPGRGNVVLGVPRTYTIVGSSENQDCFTKFKEAAVEFRNWDIAHFVGEEHLSPEISRDCIRYFYRGSAMPIHAPT